MTAHLHTCPACLAHVPCEEACQIVEALRLSDGRQRGCSRECYLCGPSTEPRQAATALIPAALAAEIRPALDLAERGSRAAALAFLERLIRERETEIRRDERKRVLSEVESAVRHEAELYSDDEDACDAIVVACGIALDSLRSPT